MVEDSTMAQDSSSCCYCMVAYLDDNTICNHTVQCYVCSGVVCGIVLGSSSGPGGQPKLAIVWYKAGRRGKLLVLTIPNFLTTIPGYRVQVAKKNILIYVFSDIFTCLFYVVTYYDSYTKKNAKSFSQYQCSNFRI